LVCPWGVPVPSTHPWQRTVLLQNTQSYGSSSGLFVFKNTNKPGEEVYVRFQLRIVLPGIPSASTKLGQMFEAKFRQMVPLLVEPINFANSV
jgi:hypothetical protein